jgi:hypothetical protein
MGVIYCVPKVIFQTKPLLHLVISLFNFQKKIYFFYLRKNLSLIPFLPTPELIQKSTIRSLLRVKLKYEPWQVNLVSLKCICC